MRRRCGCWIERLNGLGERLRAGLLTATQGNSRWPVGGLGSLTELMPDPTVVANPKRLAHALWWAAYERSVLITPNGTLSASTPMDEAVIDEATGALSEALDEVERDR